MIVPVSTMPVFMLRYIVMTNKAPKRNHLDTMMAGVEIDGVWVAPVEISVLEESTKIRVTVAEGKKHEVCSLGDSSLISFSRNAW